MYVKRVVCRLHELILSQDSPRQGLVLHTNSVVVPTLTVTISTTAAPIVRPPPRTYPRDILKKLVDM